MQAPYDEIVPLEKRDKDYLLKYIEGLDALLSTNYIISSAFELDAVFNVITNQAIQFLDCETCTIFLLNPGHSALQLRFTTDKEHTPENIPILPGKGLLSQVAGRGFPMNLSNLQGENGLELEYPDDFKKDIKTLICVPLISADEILGVALLVNKAGGRHFTREDAQLFESYAGQIAQAVRNFEHIRQEMEQQRLEREIEFCAKIQRRILPKQVPHIAGYGISGSTYPCRKVGGDWFNFVKRPSGDVDFVIADVSGKGIAAALIVAMAHSALQVLSREDIPPEQIVSDLNQFICDSIEFGQFITLFYGRLEPQTGKFTYVNAGHDAPYFFESEDSPPVNLTSTGKIIGIDRDSEYSSNTITINKGSILIMLTDGFLETTDKDGQFFADVFLDKIKPGLSADRVKPVRKMIYQQLKDFRGNRELNDDATLLVITRPA